MISIAVFNIFKHVTADKNHPASGTARLTPTALAPRWAWGLAAGWLLYSVAMLAWMDSNSVLGQLACLGR